MPQTKTRAFQFKIIYWVYLRLRVADFILKQLERNGQLKKIFNTGRKRFKLAYQMSNSYSRVLFAASFFAIEPFVVIKMDLYLVTAGVIHDGLQSTIIPLEPHRCY